jgi:hypothetical protein
MNGTRCLLTIITRGDNHCQEMSVRFPIEMLFFESAYAADTNPTRWIQEMVSFASLPSPYTHPTVMFYVYGAWGAHIKSLIRDSIQDSKEYYDALETFFKPYYFNLPNYDAESPNCS